MRYAAPVKNARRILCVFPAYASSFGTFNHAYPLMYRIKAFMPPQGLLLIAAYMPKDWQVRFIDENIKSADEQDFAWADAVFVSGMHVQSAQIHAIAARAKAAGKPVVLGGPSVSGAADNYPDFDYLHIGELGDATDRLIELLDASARPPASQIRLETQNRRPLAEFPLPAYDLVPLGRYLIGSVQFSSGCPYQCEFCDIPALYGRQPRLKSSEQMLAELDAIVDSGEHPTTVYFVDDNFIGNRKAARDLLPHLIAWQKKRGFPVMFACEATLNLAKQTEILDLMRRAGFVNVFVGIETPDIGALKSMRKEQNASVPMYEAIETINRFGMEVTSGIILGLDTDTDETEGDLLRFIERAQIPVLTINVLQALPKTPLWDRLARDGRLVEDQSLESNVRFLRPHDQVIATWRTCTAYAYEPERLFKRFEHQIRNTYIHRLQTPARGKLTWFNIRGALVLIANLVIRVGLFSSYRRPFWRAARLAWRHRQIEAIFGLGFVSRHLIEFSREALRGEQNASFYAARGDRDDDKSVQSRLVGEAPMSRSA